ncbi:MAG: hypothetical protein IKT00_04810 [Prevotella sp.]|nr:hypothetical protein [Prevotella sp.]
MNGSNQKRTDFINNALHEFRGILALEFYFTNKEYPYIPYYYDPNDDCLHADDVSVPFHYKEEEITNAVIDKSLYELQMKLMTLFQERGITLYEYD